MTPVFGSVSPQRTFSLRADPYVHWVVALTYLVDPFIILQKYSRPSGMFIVGTWLLIVSWRSWDFSYNCWLPDEPIHVSAQLCPTMLGDQCAQGGLIPAFWQYLLRYSVHSRCSRSARRVNVSRRSAFSSFCSLATPISLSKRLFFLELSFYGSQWKLQWVLLLTNSNNSIKNQQIAATLAQVSNGNKLRITAIRDK